MYPADLNSPRQELSNGGLGIVVALLVCWQLDFCRIILEVQSSCNDNFAKFGFSNNN